jgi:hypothetical protein
MPLFRSANPFAFRTLFATITVASSADTRYFSTIDAVGAVSALELRNFNLPYNCNIVACSATLYNTSANPLASGGTIGYSLVTKATETSTSPDQSYGLLSWTLPTIAGTAMTSNYSTSVSPTGDGTISISAGRNLAIQAVIQNIAGATLRGELTLYIVRG